MTNILAICNQKGGVGKTTLTINLGAALAQHHQQRVLLIDLDPQGHLTEGVGLQERYLNHDGPSLYDALIGKNNLTLDQLIQPHTTEPYSVIPASYELMLAEQALFMARNREHKLSKLLSELKTHFEWILIDCPPSLGNLTDNALNAARKVLVPIQAEATSLRAIDLLFDQIESLERGMGIHIDIIAVVPNLVQDSAMSKRILAGMHKQIPHVIPFELRKRVLVQAAWSQGRSVFGYEPSSAAERETRDEVTDLYNRLAALIVERVGEVASGGR